MNKYNKEDLRVREDGGLFYPQCRYKDEWGGWTSYPKKDIDYKLVMIKPETIFSDAKYDVEWITDGWELDEYRLGYSCISSPESYSKATSFDTLEEAKTFLEPRIDKSKIHKL